ncbi:hypothetical protein BDV93DRAFT_543307 [Ceratobasidium sp. AG-I]|nr:hypothetical protein BDV93DRAFT_543307 [Ceratobasidium sp. AG-I]
MFWFFLRSAPMLPIVTSDVPSRSARSTICSKFVLHSKIIWNAFLALIVFILDAFGSLFAFIASSFQGVAVVVGKLRVVVPSPGTKQGVTPSPLNPIYNPTFPSITVPKPALVASRSRVYVPGDCNESNVLPVTPSSLLAFFQPPRPKLSSLSSYDVDSSTRLAAACQSLYDGYTDSKYTRSMATILVTLDNSLVGHIIVPAKLAPAFMSFAAPHAVPTEISSCTNEGRAHNPEPSLQYDSTQCSILSTVYNSPSEDSLVNSSELTNDSFLSEFAAVNTSSDTSQFDAGSFDYSYWQLEADLFSELERAKSVRSINSLVVDWPPPASFDYLIESPPLDGVQPLAVAQESKVARGVVSFSPTQSAEEPWIYEAPTHDTPLEQKRAGMNFDISSELPLILQSAEATNRHYPSDIDWKQYFSATWNRNSVRSPGVTS